MQHKSQERQLIDKLSFYTLFDHVLCCLTYWAYYTSSNNCSLLELCCLSYNIRSRPIAQLFYCCFTCVWYINNAHSQPQIHVYKNRFCFK